MRTREEIKAYQKEYAKKNKEKLSAYHKEYYKDNVDYFRDKNAMRNENNKFSLDSILTRERYRNSKHGKIIQIINNINKRCYVVSNPAYKYYGARGIKNLLTYGDISCIWDRDNAGSMITPSIDRINNNGNYSFENCRFIEKSENTAKDKRKSVSLIDDKGNEINRWRSRTEASKELNISIGGVSQCCNGSTKSILGLRLVNSF